LKTRSVIAFAILLTALLAVVGCGAFGAAQAKDGDSVEVNYTGKLADGTVFDTSTGRDPLKFKLGGGQMIPGFEKAVLGMKVGEKKTITIPAAEAYGPRRDDLFIEVPRSQLPDTMAPQVGQHLQSTAQDGTIVVVTITKVSDTTVTVDANHPLAGKDLTFEIELSKIL
jgi:peptidylprolyl isomerase